MSAPSDAVYTTVCGESTMEKMSPGACVPVTVGLAAMLSTATSASHDAAAEIAPGAASTTTAAAGQLRKTGACVSSSAVEPDRSASAPPSRASVTTATW